MNPQTRKLNYGLLKAVEHLNVEEVRRLLALGADVNFHSAHNLTPLIMAAMTEPDAPGGALSSADVAPEALEVMRLLIASGANVHDTGLEGGTALHDAAMRSPCLVRCLIDAGADLDAQDRFGTTPLHSAVDRNLAVVTLLLEHGARHEIADKNGYTPLHDAVKSLPMDYPHLRHLPSTSKVQEERLKIVQALLRAGANTNAQNKYGNTALHLAVAPDLERRLDPVVRDPAVALTLTQWLIAAGADPHLPNRRKKTPASVASDSRIREIFGHEPLKNIP